MDRRNAAIRLLLAGVAFGLWPRLAPGEPYEDQQLPRPKKKPRVTETDRKKKRKPEKPIFLPEVPKIILNETKTLPRICARIEEDMAVVNARLLAMMNELQRRARRPGLSDAERRNIATMFRYLRRKYDELHLIATGRSAPYIPDVRKTVGDSFCVRAQKRLRAAERALGRYRQRNRSNRDRGRDVQDARRNMKAAHDIISRARDNFIRKVSEIERKLARTRTTSGTRGVFSDPVKARIDGAVQRLMNTSARMFELRQGQARLNRIAVNTYGVR